MRLHRVSSSFSISSGVGRWWQIRHRRYRALLGCHRLLDRVVLISTGVGCRDASPPFIGAFFFFLFSMFVRAQAAMNWSSPSSWTKLSMRESSSSFWPDGPSSSFLSSPSSPASSLVSSPRISWTSPLHAGRMPHRVPKGSGSMMGASVCSPS